jgi:hypothetical protein
MAARRKTENPDAAENPAADPAVVLDAVMDHVALERAERAEVFTADEDRWARGLRQHVDRELAALRRQLTPAEPRRKRLAPIPDELLALDRGALLARLEILRQGSGVRYAQQDLNGLTTDDLRQMVAAILEPPTEE